MCKMFGNASRHAVFANDVEELPTLDPEQEPDLSLRVRKDIRMRFLNVRLGALQSLDTDEAVTNVLRCQPADFTRPHTVVETDEHHDVIPLRMFLGCGQKCGQFVPGERVHGSFSCTFISYVFSAFPVP